MRILIACDACSRQIDAGTLAPGRRVRCVCGHALTVPRPSTDDAAVVRCSSCGAPRAGDGTHCSHCGAAYTLHETDRATICPSCFVRIGNAAKFCSQCGTRIEVSASAGEPSEYPCPACRDAPRLRHRKVGEFASLECEVCAGLWLTADTFERALTAARERDTGVDNPGIGADGSPREPGARGAAGTMRMQQGPLYRKCPRCSEMMHRTNFGKTSGVIVDRCAPHGMWFDAGELDGVLEWIRRGGERRAQEQLEEEERARAATRRWNPLERHDDKDRYGKNHAIGDGLLGVIRTIFDF